MRSAQQIRLLAILLSVVTSQLLADSMSVRIQESEMTAAITKDFRFIVTVSLARDFQSRTLSRSCTLSSSLE
jgi:hypothetical protein